MNEATEKEISTQSAELAADAENAAGEKKPQKDAWDKLGAVAPIISGVLIFIMGGYFTYSFNQQQLRLQEIQTIEKFIPHLMGNDKSKRAAILAISSLTNAELASKFAQIFASQGTVSALQSIAETGSEKDKSVAASALAEALENLAARESRLNEIESAFQKALGESDKANESLNGLDKLDEATRLEKLAAMCRERGQNKVAESLLKQAQLIRNKVSEKSEKDEKPANPPLPPVPSHPHQPQTQPEVNAEKSEEKPPEAVNQTAQDKASAEAENKAVP